MERMLEERMKDKDAAKKYGDFFQLLINAIDDEGEQENGHVTGEDSDIIHETISKGKKKGISKIEVFVNVKIEIMKFLALGPIFHCSSSWL